MILKDSFLIIEFLIAITFFIVFVTIVSSFQFLAIKNRDLAVKKLKALDLAASSLEFANYAKKETNISKNKILIKNMPARNVFTVLSSSFDFNIKKINNFSFVEVTVEVETLQRNAAQVVLVGAR